MKLNRKFIGINYFLTPEIQKTVVENLMDPKLLEPFVQVAKWNQSDLDTRRERLENLHVNKGHKIFYITQAVQRHSEMIRFDRIRLGWFRKVKSQSSTYILNKNEFFRFVVKEGREIYALHFYRDPNISDDAVKRLVESGYPNAEFYGYKFDTFIIYIDEQKYPEGFMPDNSVWGQDPVNRERFLKLLLFIELSEPEIYVIRDNGKVRLSDTLKAVDENKVKNESGIEVTLVNTLWNKIIVNESGFSVKGHIRIQPYGPGRELYKPIWIEEFQKKGYVRGLHKENNDRNA